MEDQKSSFRWFVLILAIANLLVGIIAKESIPPLFLEIQKQIPLTMTQMGTTMGIVSLAALFFSVFGGALSDRFGSRMVFGGSILIIAVSGGLRGIAGSAYEFIAMMFVLGAGVAIIGPSLLKALADLVSQESAGNGKRHMYFKYGSRRCSDKAR
jgi:MFS family permease